MTDSTTIQEKFNLLEQKFAQFTEYVLNEHEQQLQAAFLSIKEGVPEIDNNTEIPTPPGNSFELYNKYLFSQSYENFLENFIKMCFAQTNILDISDFAEISSSLRSNVETLRTTVLPEQWKSIQDLQVKINSLIENLDSIKMEILEENNKVANVLDKCLHYSQALTEEDNSSAEQKPKEISMANSINDYLLQLDKY